jgi:hypothetical protein
MPKTLPASTRLLVLPLMFFDHREEDASRHSGDKHTRGYHASRCECHRGEACSYRQALVTPFIGIDIL